MSLFLCIKDIDEVKPVKMFSTYCLSDSEWMIFT